MDYIVCVPSYKRSKLCNEKTLSTLNKHNIPSSKINVYVANQEEYAEYERVLNKQLYNKLIVGVKGLVNQRQFIMEQLPENKPIVFLDDDIKSIDLTMTKENSLDGFFKHAFDECKKNKAYIWGVYPVYNPFFRKGTAPMTTHLNFLIGAFFGIINRPHLKAIQNTTGDSKEDSERTIKYFIHDGIVLRFNHVGFETKMYGREGGLGTFDQRLQPMKEGANRLKELFPEYGSVYTRKNGMTEFRLKRIPAFNQNGKSISMNKTKKSIKTRRNKTHNKKNPKK